MIFSWFDAGEAKKLGASLAQFYATQLPLEAKALNDKKFAAKTQSAMRQLTAKVDAFKARQRLNIYTKAKLGNAFKWNLLDAGYDKAYVDNLTEWLVARL